MLYAICCVPLIVPWLMLLTMIDDHWVGGSHIRIPSAIAWLTAVPSVLCLMMGVAAMVLGIASRRVWTAVEGGVAILISPVAFFLHYIALQLQHVG